MRFRMAVLACASAAGLQAQGYGQAGGSTGGYGGSGSSGGAAIARVAVAPGGFGGGGSGFGGGQNALAGGAQGFGNAGGGGLHGVTRWTPMAEPNIIAAQFFSAGGVNVAPATGLGTLAGGSGYSGAGAPARGPISRLAVRTPARRPPLAALGAPLRVRPGNLPQASSRAATAAAHAPEEAAAEPALSATEMAGVMPASK